MNDHTPADQASPRKPGYEFTEDENKEIAAVAGALWVIGLLLTLQVVRLVTRAGSELLNLMTRNERPATWEGLLERAAMILFLGPLAYWMLRASGSLTAVTLTTGRDIEHLMSGFRSIRASYSWVCVAIIVALLIGVWVVAARSLGWI